jgi:glycine betaine/proline transport system ATP-binding protein
LLSDRTALPVQGGGCITRDAVLARLIDPRG